MRALTTVRLSANCLLVAAYKTAYKNVGVIVAGYIMQGIGYTFLVATALRFYSFGATAQALSEKGGDVAQVSRRKSRVEILLQLVNIAAIALLCNGYSNSNVAQGAGASGANISVLVKVGDVLLLAVTVAIAALIAVQLRSHTSTARRTFTFVLAALPFMTVRAAYVVYQAFTGHIYADHLGAKIVLQFIMELVAALIFCALGYVHTSDSHRQ